MKYFFVLLSIIAFSSLTIPLINAVDWYQFSNGTPRPAQSITIEDTETPADIATEGTTESSPEPSPHKPQVQNNQTATPETTGDENIPEVANEEEFYQQLQAAFDKHLTNLKIKVSKDDYNPDNISKLIERVNAKQEDTNYYIATYNVKSKSFLLNNTLTLDMQFTYSEVLKGFNSDNTTSENTLMIASYDEFAAAIQKGIENTTEKIKYKITNPALDASTKNLLEITKNVGDANRGNFVTGYEIETFGKGGFVTLKYAFDTNQVKAMQAQVKDKAAQIVASLIKPGMSELDKEKALHDYLVLNTRYDSVNFANNTVPKESYTAYGVFINGVAVCEGYASAMNILLKLAGIESKIITGTANNGERVESHAWNMVNIAGTWYYLDTTWDDPVPDKAGRVSYEYFNLTEQQIRKDHTF